MATMATKRLAREYKTFVQQESEIPNIRVKPDIENTLQWHFVVYDLPEDTPYCGGVYHGQISFPQEYPFAPPKIQFVTPNGRFRVGQPLCFSMSSYHPESWNPAWRVETILTGILSFMLDPNEPATTGGLKASDSCRRRLAIESFEFNKQRRDFQELFPDFCLDEHFDTERGFSLSRGRLSEGECSSSSSTRAPPTSEDTTACDGGCVSAIRRFNARRSRVGRSLGESGVTQSPASDDGGAVDSIEGSTRSTSDGPPSTSRDTITQGLRRQPAALVTTLRHFVGREGWGGGGGGDAARRGWMFGLMVVLFGVALSGVVAYYNNRGAGMPSVAFVGARRN